MILTAGGALVCSACGNENPAGNSFCGLCGTPLPHRPLDTPGAQGTMSLARGPLESSQPPERHSGAVDIAGAHPPPGDVLITDTSADETPRPGGDVLHGVNGPLGDVFKQAPVFVETPWQEPDRPADLPTSKELVSEDPLQDFAENLDHAQLDRPDEVATTDEALAMPSDILAFADALPPVEQIQPSEAPEFPWMEDVLQQIAELEAATPPKGPDVRPPFLDLLDLDELPPPAVEPEASTPAAVTPFFPEVSDVPQTIAASDFTPAETHASPVLTPSVFQISE